MNSKVQANVLAYFGSIPSVFPFGCSFILVDTISQHTGEIIHMREFYHGCFRCIRKASFVELNDNQSFKSQKCLTTKIET